LEEQLPRVHRKSVGVLLEQIVVKRGNKIVSQMLKGTCRLKKKKKKLL